MSKTNKRNSKSVGVETKTPSIMRMTEVYIG